VLTGGAGHDATTKAVTGLEPVSMTDQGLAVDVASPCAWEGVFVAI
jgi:hypothetical protein